MYVVKLVRHRWTGRYEAHLWDNSCRKEGQTRKGRQGERSLLPLLHFISNGYSFLSFTFLAEKNILTVVFFFWVNFLFYSLPW